MDSATPRVTTVSTLPRLDFPEYGHLFPNTVVEGQCPSWCGSVDGSTGALMGYSASEDEGVGNHEHPRGLRLPSDAGEAAASSRALC